VSEKSGPIQRVNITVLIVDDDPRFRRAAAELLADRGYQVVGEAAGVEQGFALAAALGPKAMLLDVHLPDGDGALLATRLSAGANGPRVLLTSSAPEAVSARSIADSGAAGFVAKTELAGADLDRYLKR
jgi:DNA-binding NarL/FixJ family response regulator